MTDPRLADPAEPSAPGSEGGDVPPPPRRRGRETARDMLWSLAVVGLFVAFLVAITYRDRPDPVTVVDVGPAVQAAQASAPFDPVVPTGLPSSWRATSARYEPAERSSVPNAALWHVGYVTPSEEYAAVDQGTGDPDTLVRALVTGARPDGVGEGPFAGWDRWQTPDSARTAYVRAVPGEAPSTVVVFGTAGDAELAELADSLRPAP